MLLYNSKPHEQLNEIEIFLTHTWIQEISKVVYKNTLVRHMRNNLEYPTHPNPNPNPNPNLTLTLTNPNPYPYPNSNPNLNPNSNPKVGSRVHQTPLLSNFHLSLV